MMKKILLSVAMIATLPAIFVFSSHNAKAELESGEVRAWLCEYTMHHEVVEEIYFSSRSACPDREDEYAQSKYHQNHMDDSVDCSLKLSGKYIQL